MVFQVRGLRKKSSTPSFNDSEDVEPTRKPWGRAEPQQQLQRTVTPVTTTTASSMNCSSLGPDESVDNSTSENHRLEQTAHASNQQQQSSTSAATIANNNRRMTGAAPSASHGEHEHDEDFHHPHHHHHVNRCYQENPWWLHHYQYARLQIGNFVNHPHVQLFIVTLIAVNALMMGIATFDIVKDHPDTQHAFEITDKVFLVIFTVELCMQFFFHGWRLLQDGWLIFDLIIIVTSWAFAELQIVRAFRIFRALRLITRIAVMQNLILALFGVMPRMFAIGLLLFLVSYIFAVMFTQLFKTLDLSEDYFGRIDNTFFTLFQIMTLDAWADIAREVMEEFPWAWFPFIVFVIVTGFVVVNLIIAVICDAISALHDDEKAKLHGGHVPDATTDQESEDDNDEQSKDIREQLGSLEHHVDELTVMQEQTLQTMAALAQQLAQTNSNLLRTKLQQEEQQQQRPSTPPQPME